MKCARRWRRWWCNYGYLDEAIARLDRIIAKLVQKDETARRLMSIPGFGPITASAMAATIQDTSSFAGPREFAAFLGLKSSVREHHAGLHSFRSMRRMEARRRKASALWLRHSQSLASRRQRPSQANVRSTIQRLGSATKPVA